VAQSKLSYCWHAMAARADSTAEIYRQMRDWRLSGLLVMEAGEEASKHKDQRPDAHIVHRLVGPHGDANDEHIKNYRQYYGGDKKNDPTGVRGYMDYSHRYIRRNDVILQIMNESGVRVGNTAVAVEAAIYADLTNTPIAVNFDGMGGPGGPELAVMWPFIQKAIEINKRRGENLIYIMFHEYYANHDPRFEGMRDGRYQNHDPLSHNGDDPSNMTQYNNWFIGRYARVMYRYWKEWGVALEDFPQIIIGEHGPDDLISQYKGWRPDPYDPSGSSLSQQEYGDHLLWMQDNVYDPIDSSNPYYEYAKKVVLLTIFSYNNSGGWHTFDLWASHFNGHPYGDTAWDLFNILGNFAARKMGEVEMPAMPEIQQDVLVRAAEGVTNVRTGAGTQYSIAGQIHQDAVPATFIGHSVEPDGIWFAYNDLYDIAQDVYLDAVWVREDVHLWEVEDITEPPTEEYVTFEMFEEAVSSLQQQIVLLNGAVTSLQAQISEINGVTIEQVEAMLIPIYDTFGYVSGAYGALAGHAPEEIDATPVVTWEGPQATTTWADEHGTPIMPNPIGPT